MEKLKKIIENNHSLVEGYYHCYYKRYREQDWKEQLRILFLNALSAGGEGEISKKAESIKKFEKHIEKMRSPTYKDLLIAFNVRNYKELFKKFKSKKFPQIGAKKSALFLRDILFFNNIIQKIPQNLIKEYLVPVDRVIVRTVNSIFDKNYVLGHTNTFDEVNNLAKQLFPDKPILLEDLWFWGRFYRCKENKKSKIHYCKFNEDLLSVDINVTKDYRMKLIDFSKKQKECPFKEICSKY
jgi:hypothetical protein